MKKIWRNIHLWLGLLAGLIFFTECLSGTVLVFEEEITSALHSARYEVKQGQQLLALDELVEALKARMPDVKIKSVKVYNDPLRTVELSVVPAKKKEGRSGAVQDSGIEKAKDAGKGKRGGKGKLVFINPYTAEITAVMNPAAPTFFTWALAVHQTLLAGETGKTILGISTFVVFILLITGIILWFPKKRKQLNARLKIKTDGSWKRINHDLHIVLGFYCTFFILILLLSSLSWSFKWANTALYILTGSKPGFPEQRKSVSAIVDGTKRISFQQALRSGQQQFGSAPYWSIAMPEDKDGTVNVTSASVDALHRNGFDNLSLDQRTGAIIQVSLLKDMPGGWQLRRYMKPVHTGAIGGIPTKLLAFFVSLISASFPVTGVILWLNRIAKKPKKAKIAI